MLSNLRIINSYRGKSNQQETAKHTDFYYWLKDERGEAKVEINSSCLSTSASRLLNDRVDRGFVISCVLEQGGGGTSANRHTATQSHGHTDSIIPVTVSDRYRCHSRASVSVNDLNRSINKVI